MRTALRAALALVLGVGWAYVPAQAQNAVPGVLHVPGEVQFATVAGQYVAHTIRHADGSWDGFGIVPGSSARRHMVASIVNGEAHLLYEYVNGHPPHRYSLQHQIRHADGNWTSASIPTTEFATDLAVTTVSGELHLVRSTATDPVLRHKVRHGDGTWSDLPELPIALEPGSSAGIAGYGDELRLLLRPWPVRTLRYYVARADGVWTLTADVPFNPRKTSVVPFAVDIAQVGAELHAVVAGTDGMLYHAVRYSHGGWTTFHGIYSQIPIPEGSPGTVSTTGAGNELHVAMNMAEGGLFHAVRHADGSWSQFGDVQAEAGQVGASYTAIAGT